MPRRRKAAEGNGSKGTSEAPAQPLEARDLSTADPYDLVSGVIVRPERSRTRQRSRRPSGPQESPPVEQAAEQERSKTKIRRRVDGAGAAAADAGAEIRRPSRRTISPVHDAARVPPEGPLDASGRHPTMRKLSQVVLHGDEQGSACVPAAALADLVSSRNRYQEVPPPSSCRRREPLVARWP